MCKGSSRKTRGAISLGARGIVSCSLRVSILKVPTESAGVSIESCHAASAKTVKRDAV